MKRSIQRQVIVRPETATFEPIGDFSHFGQVDCPFCGETHTIAGPKRGLGLVHIHGETCPHCLGIAAGDGYDITILFNGRSQYETH